MYNIGIYLSFYCRFKGLKKLEQASFSGSFTGLYKGY